MTLVNCIIEAGNEVQSAKHKQEFLGLGFMRILEVCSLLTNQTLTQGQVLYQEHNPLLDEQLDAFAQQIDQDGMWYRTVNLEYLSENIWFVFHDFLL